LISPKHPRRRRRQRDVPEETDHVGDEDRVPEAGERLVPPQVHPQEREADDGELGIPVRPRCDAHEELGRVDESLERELDQAVEVALESDHAQPVLERARRVAVGDPPRQLVCEQEAEPDAELAGEVDPPTWKNATVCGVETCHDVRPRPRGILKVERTAARKN
jgi:hypothetical protein